MQIAFGPRLLNCSSGGTVVRESDFESRPLPQAFQICLKCTAKTESSAIKRIGENYLSIVK